MYNLAQDLLFLLLKYVISLFFMLTNQLHPKNEFVIISIFENDIYVIG